MPTVSQRNRKRHRAGNATPDAAGKAFPARLRIYTISLLDIVHGDVRVDFANDRTRFLLFHGNVRVA